MVAATPEPAIRTEPVPVTVRLNSGVEVSGNVHVRPDSYQTRVSDLLNRGTSEFLPVTDATLERPDGGATEADCVIIRLAQVDCVLCTGPPSEPEVEVADDVEHDEAPVEDDEPATAATPQPEMAATAVW